ncbi:MAG: hypothetical protein OXC65_01325 [Thiotrichales bacterium]|nr:hypothetical protein [Thiotrichales bacterium]
MKYAHIGLMALAAIVIAGCGGGDSVKQSDLDKVKKDLETTKGQLETAQGELETTKGQLETAQGQLRTERGKVTEANRQRDEAKDEVKDLETLVGETTDQLERSRAKDTIDGIMRAGSGPLASSAVGVMPEYRAKAKVTSSGITFKDKSDRRDGNKWYFSAFEAESETGNMKYDHELVVYTDLGPPEDEDFQSVHTGAAAVETGSPPRRTGWRIDFTNGETNSFVTASGFSQLASGAGDGKLLTANQNYLGSYGGARGNYRCTAGPCNVRFDGANYIFTQGTWQFITSSASAKVKVKDVSYMHFGWWRRETENTDALDFKVFSSGMNAASENASAFDALNGSANYTGRAVGHYAVHSLTGTPLHGSFTANASLTANFTADSIQGKITNFRNHKSQSLDWSLDLNAADMSGGDVDSNSGTTRWHIGENSHQGTTAAGNSWDATFHSEETYAGQVPDGVVGEFSAIFGTEARMIGAFGAHKK